MCRCIALIRLRLRLCNPLQGQQTLAFSRQQAGDGQCVSERISGSTVYPDLHGCDARQRCNAMQIAGDGGRDVARLLQAFPRGGWEPCLLLGIGNGGEGRGNVAFPGRGEGSRLQGSHRLQGIVETGHGLVDQTGASLRLGDLAKRV
jgi:hypothetical protein